MTSWSHSFYFIWKCYVFPINKIIISTIKGCCCVEICELNCKPTPNRPRDRSGPPTRNWLWVRGRAWGSWGNSDYPRSHGTCTEVTYSACNDVSCQTSHSLWFPYLNQEVIFPSIYTRFSPILLAVMSTFRHPMGRCPRVGRYRLGQKTTIVDCISNRPLPCDLYTASLSAGSWHLLLFQSSVIPAI